MIQEPLSAPRQIYKLQELQQVQKQSEQTGYIAETQAYPITLPINSHSNSQRILLIASPAIATNTQSIQTIPRKRIIRIPFLPRSVQTQHSVKQNLPKANGSVKNSNPNTVLQELNVTQETFDHVIPSILTNTKVNYNSHSSNQCYQVLHPVSGNPEYIEIQSKSTKPPLTLASMAGIQLTGSDESPMEMSGATPPIATVEEINVPVFIDEYFQQATPTSTTAATFISNSTQNNNNNNQIDGNGHICLEAAEEFEGDAEEDDESYGSLEFDIEMIANDNQTISLKMENNSKNNMYFFSDNTNPENTHSNNNNFNSNTFSNMELEVKEEPQYLISPGMVHYNLSEDTTSLGLDSADIVFTEEAIDISAMNNDNYTFSDVFCSSQNDPMLTDGLDNFSQKLTNAEPVIPNIDYDAEYALCIKQQQIKQEDLDMNYELQPTISTSFEDINTPLVCSNNLTTPSVKRRLTTSRGMSEKRRRLRLNTSAKLSMNTTTATLNTPDVVKLIEDLGKHQQPQFNDATTTQDIINDLLNMCDSPLQSNANTTCWTALIDDNNTCSSSNDSYTLNHSSVHNPASLAASPSNSSFAYTDEDPPYTPQSFISSTNHTNQTGDFTTSPNSPALSTSTATKKRGRPCKEHSDKPDPARLENLPESERKKAEDRAKNNEASRLSRLKNKQKEEAEVEEAKHLTERNLAMRAELEHLNKVSAKLKRALQRRQYRTQ